MWGVIWCGFPARMLGWLASFRRQPDAELAAAPSDADIMGQVRLLRRAAAREGHRYFP